MNFLPVSIALLISAAAGLASVSLVAPIPREDIARPAEAPVPQTECTSSAELNFLGSTRTAEEFPTRSGCELRIEAGGDR